MRKALAVFAKDVRVELRGRETLGLMLLFAALTALVFGFSFSVSRAATLEVFPGLAWVAFYFAGLVGLSRSIAQERRNRTFEGLLLSPGDAAGLYFGKLLANVAFMLLTEALSLALLALFFNVPPPRAPALLGAVLVLGTAGFAAAGTFFAVIASATRVGEALLPVLLFPVAAPAVIAAVAATTRVFNGDPLGPWLRVLVVYDLIGLVLPFLLFEDVLEVWGE